MLNSLPLDTLKDRAIEQIDEYSFRYKISKKIVKLPEEYSNDLVYFIGALIGDGTLHSPIKRKEGGYYLKVSFVGKYEFIEIIKELSLKLFGWNPIIFKRKDREKTWRLEINSIIIHNFFNKTIGIPSGDKRGKTSFFVNLNIPKKYYRDFLAGLIDTDGYVCNKYIGLIQKDKKFLEIIRSMTKENLGIEFNKPIVNRKINDIPVGWIICISRKEAIKSFIKEIPLRYKILRMPS